VEADLRTRFLAPAALLIVAVALPPRAAMAQDNSATVQALFDEGKRLEALGDHANACPKFLASYDLEHRLGTLLNLAYCYEETGKLASAWARFVEARTLATRAGQAERAAFATQHAAALEPQLSRLVLTVLAPAAGLRITRDGTAVDTAEYGVAVPADEGEHVIEATAPGKQAWRQTVEVRGDAAIVPVAVPALADLPVEPPATPEPQRLTPPVPVARSSWTGRRIAAAAVAGVGIVGLGVGSAFGFMAVGKKNESEPYCNQGGVPNDCLQPGVQPRNASFSDANVSTVLFAAGGALVVGGLVLWLTAPSGEVPPPSVSLDVSGVRLTGSF
jgi:serine/threonine-protein kinase